MYRFNTFSGIEIFFNKQCPLKLMSGNKSWSSKIDAKLLSDLVIFSIISSDTQLDFHNSIRVVPVKDLKYFLAGINTK